MTNRAVFLDRDGVINRTIVCNGCPYPPSRVSELEILPGVPEALERLRNVGFRLIVVTNQPDVARGVQTKEVIETIHSVLRRQLFLDDIRVCYHDDADQCHCRKPAPGLLLDAAREWELDISSCFMVGDRWRDIEAGQRAGCSSIYIDYGYTEPPARGFNFKVKSLLEATDWILTQN